MSEWKKITCPRCSAVNGPGAPACHTCGTVLTRLAFAARREDDDEDDAPRRPIKKKPPRDEIEDDERRRPVKRRRDEDDEDDEPRRPKKKRRDAEDDETSLRDNTILNLFLPAGVSIWAMGAFLCGIVGVLVIGAGYPIGGYVQKGAVAIGVSALGTLCCLLALPLGGLAFFLRPKKATYGHVTGYIRAGIGIVLGLAGTVGGPIAIWIWTRTVWR